MELLFERRDEGPVPYAIVNGSMARTFAIEGSCIGFGMKSSHSVLIILIVKEKGYCRTKWQRT